MASLCMDTHISIHQSPHQQQCLLYAKQDRTQDTAAVVFFFIQSGLMVFLYPLLAHSFTSLFALKPLKSYERTHCKNKVILIAQNHFLD